MLQSNDSSRSKTSRKTPDGLRVLHVAKRVGTREAWGDEVPVAAFRN